MGCQHLDELYELYLLGALADESAQELSEHVERRCPVCMARLREAAQAVYLLTMATKTARPDPKLKARLLQRLRHKG